MAEILTPQGLVVGLIIEPAQTEKTEPEQTGEVESEETLPEREEKKRVGRPKTVK